MLSFINKSWHICFSRNNLPHFDASSTTCPSSDQFMRDFLGGGMTLILARINGGPVLIVAANRRGRGHGIER